MSVPLILYQCYLWGVPVVILTALCAIRWKEGFWGNLVSLGNVLFSILIAAGWWEDAAYLLALQFPGWLFYADTVAIWTIFLLSLLILETLTRLMSRVNVKFADAIEKAGSGLMIFLLFVVLFLFFRFTEQIGPVGENVTDVPGDAAAVLKGAEINKIRDMTPKPDDSLLVQAFRLLSAGNLASFTAPTQFDYEGEFLRNHLMRRQVIMYRAKSGSSSSSTKDKIPTRQARDNIKINAKDGTGNEVGNETPKPEGQPENPEEGK
ncbi:hypothetical protein FACS1894189_1830 [Planctomycetales bacterium]|nr:hypothetical protein FACS1894189_1830 [Planctomycetales bacterium]